MLKKLDLRNLFIWLTVYFAISVILIASSQEAISVVTNEIGDFAANSLLIQDAKSLSLLVGNYSRVGFNHPGPAILYVLAAGEYLFFDKLGWVSYPFVGQLIAVACYNAFWFTLIAILLRRMGLAKHVVLIAVAAFCLVTAIEDHSFFNGIWMPHLYFFPFAVLMLSLARLVQERADSLWMMAISSGFLINGHASFIAILGLMLIVVLVYSYVAGSQRGGVLRPEFLKANGRSLLLAVCLLTLFFVPMLILTVREFPGPIGDYIAFGGGHKPNKLKKAIGFVSLYWGGTFAFLGALVTFVLLWVSKKVNRKSVVVRSLLVVIFAATLAMLFYARYGVDYLEQTYIGFFYFATPSILVVAVIICVAQFFGSGRYITLFSVAASVILLSASYSMVSKPPFYLVHYHGLQVSEINQALSKAKGDGGRLVLDLDDSNDWSHVWAMATGIGANAKRQGESIFCINRNWYISFTKQLKCTPEELAHSKRFVVRRSVEGSQRNPDINLGGISFFEYSPPAALVPGVLTMKKDRDLFTDYLLGSGWTVPDESFTWSEGYRALIYLPPVSSGNQVALDLGAFVPLSDSHQRVTVSVDGVEQETVEFTATAMRQKVEIKQTGKSGEPTQIALQIEKPISPVSVGMGQDTRLLGVGLYGLEVTPATGSN
ncbi:hypothetical protein N5J43_20845 [Pseudomonas nicosulfuronedens]|uniref:hypothetical protein n=2 Tax=Pseudomonas nicosulfuronedens TaxID=2571105 RepID=UPI00244AFC81|nr:hypothetical protein [Pseudomonas nicosulfuronedens]MDH1012689.1 hypothetical protein [Pseudomonas nicosulfuronedens]MDH1981410.1 hypothetical protein [Pseudomonas nicosulfuronedens]MDH2029530.1 hypothetical protein [Pseudomonas nicosulfuronedens]